MRLCILPVDDPASCGVIAPSQEEPVGCMSDTEECNSVVRRLRRTGFQEAWVLGCGLPRNHWADPPDAAGTAGNLVSSPLFSSDDREEIAAIDAMSSLSIEPGGKTTAHPSGDALKGCEHPCHVRNREESFRRKARVLNHLPVPALAIDSDGTLVAWNRAVEEMTGVRADGLLGKGGYEYAVPFYGERRPLLLNFIIRPEDERLPSLYKIWTSEKDLLVGESRANFRNGRECSLLIHAKPWYDNRGTLIGAVETVHDVSGWEQQSREVTHNHEVQRDRNQELERYSRELTRANRTLGLMNIITRHDILNQLTILNGYLSLIIELTTDPAILDYVKKGKESTRAIEKHIQFTRQYNELGTCKPEWQNVKTVFAQAVSQLPSPGITFLFEPSDLEIYADRLLMKIFYNLIDNSRRHGKHVSKITVSTREDQDDLILVYEDDGVGISPSEKEQIFSQNFGRNTGLGLFLVQEILRITGIAITETGVEGKGARFEMRIHRGSFRSVET